MNLKRPQSVVDLKLSTLRISSFFGSDCTHQQLGLWGLLSKPLHCRLPWISCKSQPKSQSGLPTQQVQTMHLQWPQEVLRFVLPLPNRGLVWGWLGILNLPSNYEVDCIPTRWCVFLEESTWCSKTFGYGWILGYNMIQYGIIWYNGQQNWSYSTKPAILGVWWFWPSQIITVH